MEVSLLTLLTYCSVMDYHFVYLILRRVCSTGCHINVENTNVENAKTALTSKMPFYTNVENEQIVGFELS